MNIEITNKIKSRMAGELLPEQLNIQYGEPRDVKNRGFTANLNKRHAAELPQTKETHQWKV